MMRRIEGGQRWRLKRKEHKDKKGEKKKKWKKKTGCKGKIQKGIHVKTRSKQPEKRLGQRWCGYNVAKELFLNT